LKRGGEQKIVGNDRQLLTLFLLTLTPNFGEMTNIMIKGPTGTGKSKIARKVLSVFPKKDVYYTSSASEKALLNEHREINSAKRIYVEELDKIKEGSFLAEIIKSITDIDGEGFDYVRALGTSGSEHIHLDPKQVLLTTTLVDIPREIARRYIFINVEEGQRIIDAVVEMKLKIDEWQDSKTKVTNAEISNYLTKIPSDVKVRTIGLSYLYPLISRDNQDIATKVDYLRLIIKSVTIWHYLHRVQIGGEYLSTIEDIYLGYYIFNEILSRTLLEFDDTDKAILKLILAGKNTVISIGNELKRSFGISIKRSRIDQKLERMDDNGLINVDRMSNPNRYSINTTTSDAPENPVSWMEINKYCLGEVNKRFPNQYESYKATIKTKVKDPFSGEVINLSKKIETKKEIYDLETLTKIANEFDKEIFSEASIQVETEIEKYLKGAGGEILLSEFCKYTNMAKAIQRRKA
jgi:hypothetical protein